MEWSWPKHLKENYFIIAPINHKPFEMKTFQIAILKEADNQRVTDLLQDLQRQNLIEIKQIVEASVSPSHEQIEEMIDESELGPYYSEEEARGILGL